MDQAADGNDEQLQAGALKSSTQFHGTEAVAQARARAHTFLAGLRNEHGVPVSGLAAELVELVVSELVTNARKYAPGPYLLTLELRDVCVEVSVRDSNPALPTILAPDPYRIGRHGLEIVAASAQTLRIEREPGGKRITAAVALAGPADS
ncbi:ATP-binding protein [Streptomyces uncialis]|uniref:Regulator n=1 Tax=Streptomyces uncialis TaxID=1048205 RepID=A0A1Q4V7I6_9ACTN|nr:ATP-binding protein [Streptomyces uncialis]OKH93812.1 regulator [Streptomyces uncialis]WTE08839.1 ATP-binding protein [Streptomyces uncialis]